MLDQIRFHGRHLVEIQVEDLEANLPRTLRGLSSFDDDFSSANI